MQEWPTLSSSLMLPKVGCLPFFHSSLICDPVVVSIAPKKYVTELAKAENSKTPLMVYKGLGLRLAAAVLFHLPLTTLMRLGS